MYYNLNKVSLSRGGSYKDSPKWLKNKKATIKCFQYALSVALNYEQIEKNSQRISNIKAFVDKYNRKETDFPSHNKGWKKFESNNKSCGSKLCGS